MRIKRDLFVGDKVMHKGSVRIIMAEIYCGGELADYTKLYMLDNGMYVYKKDLRELPWL